MLTEAQQEMRKTGCGGSEVAAIAGVDPYRTAWDVYVTKVDGWQQEDGPHLERGRFLEDGVARWYAHRGGWPSPSVLNEPGTLRHPREPLAICTPDRLVPFDGPSHEPGVSRLLSIKVPGPHVREQWGEPGTDDVPLPYLLQLQWEFGIVGEHFSLDPVAHLAAPIDGDLRVYAIRRDPEIFASLLDRVKAFWREHVLPKVPPPINGGDNAAAWLKNRFPRDRTPLLRASIEDEGLAIRLQGAELARDAAEEALGAVKNEMRQRIGDAQGIEGAFGRVTWKANRNGVRSLKTHWRKA